MAKIRNYDTREVGDITGDEFAVITDTTEEVTYKVNLTDYIASMAGGGEGATGDFLTKEMRRVTVVDGSVTSIVDETEWINVGLQHDWNNQYPGQWDSAVSMWYLGEAS